MLKYLKEYRFYILLGAFVLIPLIAIDTTARAPRSYRFYDRAILWLTTPVQAFLSWGIDSGVSFFHHYIFLRHTREENQQLLDENKRLIQTIIHLEEAQAENSRLRKLLAFHEQFRIQGVVARVIAHDVSTEFRGIRINRGESSGIKKDMAVLHADGLVGRVYRVTADTADVLTLVDLLSAVDSVVERSRARGIVEGLTDDTCRLKFALRTDDIQPGDRLLTSGTGGIFPRGISVGTVSKTTKKAYGISQEVEVLPAVDFSKLEEILVALSFNVAPSHLQALEKLPLPERAP